MTEREWWRQLFLAALREEGIINPERFALPVHDNLYAGVDAAVKARVPDYISRIRAGTD
jgi:hypothetical protein